MVKLILKESFAWVVASPIVFYIYLLLFNAGRPEGYPSLFDELLLYTIMTMILHFPLPLILSILLNRRFPIYDKELLKIDSPILFIILFLLLGQIDFILIDKILRVYVGPPHVYLLLFIEAIVAYAIVYFLSREKGAVE
jgi:hypothetical protein